MFLLNNNSRLVYLNDTENENKERSVDIIET